MCSRISTGITGDFSGETHLGERFGRTDKNALIMCLKNLNISRGFLDLHRKQKIAVNKCWVQESEIGEECRQFWT